MRHVLRIQCLLVSFLLRSTHELAAADEPTRLELDGAVYEANPDKRGSTGGGVGYRNIVTGGHYTAKDLDSLLDALSRAQSGKVVFIPGETEIDLTPRVFIEQLVLEVPSRFTLAGNRGHDGARGALLVSDALQTPVMIRATGPNVRITGLRIQGPNPKRYLEHHRRAFGPGGGGHAYYYKFPTQDGVSSSHNGLEVDNCEISGFGHAAVHLAKGDQHHVHHNFIHHCQYNGIGYSVPHSLLGF